VTVSDVLVRPPIATPGNLFHPFTGGSRWPMPATRIVGATPPHVPKHGDRRPVLGLIDYRLSGRSLRRVRCRGAGALGSSTGRRSHDRKDAR
jgi:hypothetical protein